MGLPRGHSSQHTFPDSFVFILLLVPAVKCPQAARAGTVPNHLCHLPLISLHRWHWQIVSV